MIERDRIKAFLDDLALISAKHPASAGSGERFREGKWRRKEASNPRYTIPRTIA